MTLAIYDTYTGKIISTITPSEMVSVSSVLVDIPEGKNLDHIEDGEPVFVDRPMTVEERVALLEASQNDQDDAIMELAEIVSEEV